MTPDGQPSVFDMIRVLGGQKAPHKVWERIAEVDSEVLTKCQNFKFPGRGQRSTPVVKTKEDVYYILGLLPGTVGKKYREQAAELFVAYLDNPAKLASSLVKRLNREDAAWFEARLNSKRTRYTAGDKYKEHGVHGYGFARCTNAVYEEVLGADAKTLKEEIALETNLPVKSINPRDHMTIKELNDIEFAERVAAGQLTRTSAFGNKAVEKVVRTSAKYVQQLLDGEISIPGIA